MCAQINESFLCNTMNKMLNKSLLAQGVGDGGVLSTTPLSKVFAAVIFYLASQGQQTPKK